MHINQRKIENEVANLFLVSMLLAMIRRIQAIRASFSFSCLLSALTLFCSFKAFAEDRVSDDSLVTLTNMPLDQLHNVKVTSVSKKSEDRFEAPAAVYVITSDDIRRSGATSIPDALRMVPGLDVAQIDSNKWAISARGFNRQFSNKLLVLFDGRSVYTPLFSGVYWDVQDINLEDIDRIEVIRGPGATLWGSNAVNGVINIITKNSKLTQGDSVSAIAGNIDKGTVSYRHGGEDESKHLSYRTFGKFEDKDEFKTLSGAGNSDDWKQGRVGFRSDWEATSRDTIMFSGNAYRGDESQLYQLPSVPGLANGEETYHGGNILMHWDKVLSNTSDVSFQSYLDYSNRDMENVLGQSLLTFDTEIQHRVEINKRNEIIWGGGYRYIQDELDSISYLGNEYLDYRPATQRLNLYNIFLQHKHAIIPDTLFLTTGSKLEHNDYTGWEIQPNARLAWLPNPSNTVWASVARAVRTPTRGEKGLSSIAAFVPANTFGAGTPAGFVRLSSFANPDFDSETLIAYELGYRSQPFKSFSTDIALFLNDYSRLRTFEPGPLFPGGNSTLEYTAENNGYGYTRGIEINNNISILPEWTVTLNYTYLDVDLKTIAGSHDTSIASEQNSSPHNQVGILSRYNIAENIELDSNLYLVSAVHAQKAGQYTRFDVRVAWRPAENVEMSLVGQNLFNSPHPEFKPFLYSRQTEIGPIGYAKIAITF